MFKVNISELIRHTVWQFGLVGGLKLCSSEKCIILAFSVFILQRIGVHCYISNELRYSNSAKLPTANTVLHNYGALFEARWGS